MKNKEQLIEKLINTGIVDKNLHSIFSGKAQVLIDKTWFILITYDMKDMRKYQLKCGDLSYGDYDAACRYLDSILQSMRSEFEKISPRQLPIAPTTTLYDLNQALSTLFNVRKVESETWYTTSPAQLLKEYQDILHEHFQD